MRWKSSRTEAHTRDVPDWVGWAVANEGDVARVRLCGPTFADRLIEPVAGAIYVVWTNRIQGRIVAI